MNAPLPKGLRVLETAQKKYITGILELACENLDISDTQRANAEQRYIAVGQWLSDKDNVHLINSTIYTQGSIRIGTAIKPLQRNEFDVDLICHLPSAQRLTPLQVRNLVGDRLKAHKNYKEMLEPLKRGWRLTYANEFHMDITPCIVDPTHASGGVLVPDRELQNWKESNPKGYAEWFENIAKYEPAGFLIESLVIKANIEAMPDKIQFKGTLRRIVQLLKRHRDVWCKKQPAHEHENAPISVIITTLAAKSYSRLLQNKYDNAVDLLMDIIDLMPNMIELKHDSSGRLESWVTNPMNESENFADKWANHPQRKTAFNNWHQDLTQDLNKLAEQSGLDGLAKGLESLVDESSSKAALKEAARRVTNNRDYNATVVSASGLITSGISNASTAVPKNTFFGN